MKIRKVHYFFILVSMTLSAGWTNPNMDWVEVQARGESMKTIGEITRGGVKWSLARHSDGIGGALYVLREKDGKSEVVGGDSSPFPLSRYGIEPEIVSQLADLYVEYEIKNSQGGLKALKERVASYNRLPHDLKDAYSKYMEVDALPVYASLNRDLTDMIAALKAVERAEDQKKLEPALLQKVGPLLPHMIIRIADSPHQELGEAIINAVAAHPGSSSLQELTAVYAGRQQEHFLKSWDQLDSLKRPRVLQALHAAIKAKLVGSVVKSSVKDLILSLSRR